MSKIYLILLLSIIVLVASSELYHKIPNTFSATVEMYNRILPHQVYSGIIHKTTQDGKWLFSAKIATGNQTYLNYHNGKMMYETMYNGEKLSKCIESNDVPPFQGIEEIVKDATLFHQRDTFDQLVNNCKGNLYLTSYAGETFAICQNKQTNLIESIISESMVIKIKSWHREVVSINHFVNSCQENHQVYPLKTSGSNWFQDPLTCQKPQKDEKTCTGAILTKSEANYTCIFLHGVGQDSTEPTLDEFPDYWGQVHLYTPQCKIRKFIRQETKNRGWDNPDLQKEYCKLALIHQDPNDKFIRNKLLFVHSMGNMILAAAIKNGLCELDKTSSKWFNIMGPVSGSKAASWLDAICKEDGRMNYPYKFIAEMGGYCVPGKNVPYHAYKTLNPDYPGLKELLPFVQHRVSGILCGGSSYGLQTRYGVALYTLSLMVGYGEDNDGMVGFSSCNLGWKDKFQSDYNHAFYLSSVNHADGTSRNGEGWWGSSRKPLTWFGLRK